MDCRAFILLANPKAAQADTTVRFLPASGGAPIIKQVPVPANGRVTINIEPEDLGRRDERDGHSTPLAAVGGYSLGLAVSEA